MPGRGRAYRGRLARGACYREPEQIARSGTLMASTDIHMSARRRRGSDARISAAGRAVDGCGLHRVCPARRSVAVAARCGWRCWVVRSVVGWVYEEAVVLAGDVTFRERTDCPLRRSSCERPDRRTSGQTADARRRQRAPVRRARRARVGVAKNTKMRAAPIAVMTTKRAARDERMSLQWLRAASSRGGIAEVREKTRFVGSLGETTLPQSTVAYLNDPNAMVPAMIRKVRPPSPTRTLAARTTLPIGSVWHSQAPH